MTENSIASLLQSLPPLPVSQVLAKLADRLSGEGGLPANCVLVAPPGAGKTTRVPLYLAMQDWAAEKKIIVLEPRRLAARAAANHMAKLLGEPIGETIGLRIRFDNRSGPKTRVEVVTEGVFTRMILDDPELTGIAAVLFDEFHERSLDAELGLALALDAQAGLRNDLRLLPMSATMDGAKVAALMGNASIIESEGQSFPVTHLYRPRNPQNRIDRDMADAILEAVASEKGSILAFLPGQGEIHQTASLLEGRLPENVTLHKLFGAMGQKDQDDAIRPAPQGRRKIVLATSLAETSLTIDGVRVVIDSGLSRIPRFDPASGITRLETVKASRSAITQRAGRAGRTAPGIAIRLWHESHNIGLVAHDRAQILDADLRPLVLDILSWGVESPAQLAFADQPPAAAYAIAVEQLIAMGAIQRSQASGKLSLLPLGKAIRQLPVAPHLAAMVLRAARYGAQNMAARLAIVCSEAGLGGNEPDLELRLENLGSGHGTRNKQGLALAAAIADKARQLAIKPHSAETSAKNQEQKSGNKTLSAGALLSLGMADRIAIKTKSAGGRTGGQAFTDYLLANGKRAGISESEPLAKNTMLVIAEMQGKAERPRILSAAAIGEDEFITHHGSEIIEERQLSLDAKSGQLRARQTRRFGKLVLASANVAVGRQDRVDEAIIGAINEFGLEILKPSPAIRQLLARLNFAHSNLDADRWPCFADETLASEARLWLLPYIPGITAIGDIGETTLANALKSRLPEGLAASLDAFLPARFVAPTGTSIAIRYQGDQAIVPIRVQELFGLDQHPRLGDAHNDKSGFPITFELLSPAMRPIQTTMDLPGFWRGSWAETKREMKGRYPRHVWPDEPQFADPTRRAKPRGT